jgi:putative hemolysin
MKPIYRIIEITRNYFQTDQEKLLIVKVAESSRERKAALKLRKEVIAGELPAGASALLDADEDEFDEHCRHLVVIDLANGEIVGTHRVLHANSASLLGRYISEAAFNLTGLQDVRSSLIEVGRSCVHPNYSTASVFRLL